MGLIEKIQKYMPKSSFTYLCENPRFLKDFKFWLTRENKKKSFKTTTDGQYINKYGCWEGTLNLERHIVFFEWSCVTGSKRIFRTIKDFYLFLEESKITYPDYSMRKLIEENDMSFMTCVPGKAQLIHATSVDGLKTALEKLKDSQPKINPHTYHY